jgi:hypothetical protein
MRQAGASRTIFFAPPGEAAERYRRDAGEQSGRPADELQISLHEEPEEEIRVLGLMMLDVQVMADMLRGLAFDSLPNYRGSLRVVLGAAERMRQRCTRLIGDGEAAPAPRARAKAGGAS